MARSKLNAVVGVGKSHEFRCEQPRGSFIKSPVRQRHPGIDTLKFALEIQQIGSVPWQEPPIAVRFSERGPDMHLAEFRETTAALAVEYAEGGKEAIAFPGRQGLSILADPDHQWRRAQRGGGSGIHHFQYGVAEVQAGLLKFSGHPKPDWRTVPGQIQLKGRRPPMRPHQVERDFSAAAGVPEHGAHAAAGTGSVDEPCCGLDRRPGEKNSSVMIGAGD
jgi:hypothetical protein